MHDIPDFSKPSLTKIIATVGPATADPSCIARLIETGVSVFRLNFGHGSIDDRAAAVATIRRQATQIGKPVAILGDVQGPKIRVGDVQAGGIAVEPGEAVIVQKGPCIASSAVRPIRICATYPDLVDDVEPGHRLLIADGAVRLLILQKRRDELDCIVSPGGGGRISTGKGINLPDTHINAAVLDEQDWQDVEWAVENELDFLAMSFVRTAADIELLRIGVERLAAKKDASTGEAISPMRIIAKIELPEAVEHANEITNAADGVMIARGDLGVEMDLARVPVIQKQLVQTIQSHGKPCIIATQMLESMIHSPSPTRAEANDVACAIMDGVDAVMLSGETAVGGYPTVAVENMRRIAIYTEDSLARQPARAVPPQKLVESRYRTAALAHGAWHIAQDIGAKFVVVWSQHGGGARYLSQNDFNIPIIACTSDHRAARQMQLLRGVLPVRMPLPEGLAHFTTMIDAYLLETGWAQEGDHCVLMAGAPIGHQGVTNSLAVHVIGDSSSGFAGMR